MALTAPATAVRNRPVAIVAALAIQNTCKCFLKERHVKEKAAAKPAAKSEARRGHLKINHNFS